MIYLLRHGIDDETYIGGWSDVDLIPEGIKQVNDVGKFLKTQNFNIETIYSSDVKRTITTANIIKKYLNVEVIYTDRLRELNKGLLTGMKEELAEIMYPEYFENTTVDMRYPNGESLRDLYERVKILLDNELFKKNNTLLITHRGVINMIYAILKNEEVDVDKKKYGVTHASLHECDIEKRLIKKII